MVRTKLAPNARTHYIKVGLDPQTMQCFKRLSDETNLSVSELARIALIYTGNVSSNFKVDQLKSMDKKELVHWLVDLQYGTPQSFKQALTQRILEDFVKSRKSSFTEFWNSQAIKLQKKRTHINKYVLQSMPDDGISIMLENHEVLLRRYMGSFFLSQLTREKLDTLCFNAGVSIFNALELREIKRRAKALMKGVDMALGPDGLNLTEKEKADFLSDLKDEFYAKKIPAEEFSLELIFLELVGDFHPYEYTTAKANLFEKGKKL